MQSSQSLDDTLLEQFISRFLGYSSFNACTPVYVILSEEKDLRSAFQEESAKMKYHADCGTPVIARYCASQMEGAGQT